MDVTRFYENQPTSSVQRKQVLPTVLSSTHGNIARKVQENPSKISEKQENPKEKVDDDDPWAANEVFHKSAKENVYDEKTGEEIMGFGLEPLSEKQLEKASR